MAVSFTLPDMLASFPYRRNLSVFYSQAKAESSAWLLQFHPFEDDGYRRFNLCDFNLLACLAYSPREYELIRLGCDLMSIFYVFDEYSDVTDGPGAEEIRTVIMDALRNPDKRRPDDEVMLGKMCQDWWRRANKQVNPNSTCLKHFIHDFDLYTAAVVKEAEDRGNRVYRSFEEYLAIRRDSSGCYPSFVVHEFGLDLPEEIYLHPQLKRLREQATDLIALGNDINSYAMEKSRGLELHNAVELVMKERGLSIQESIDWLERYAATVMINFLNGIANLPSWEGIDEKIQIYTDGLAQWVRGNDDWTFESGRYFGEEGLKIQISRTMRLLPESTGFVKKCERG